MISVSVAASGAPVIDDIVIVSSTCGASNGSIQIFASGGVGLLSYSINGGTTFQAGNLFPNLPSGTYSIVVRDEANDDYGFTLLHTVSFGHDIVGPLAGYVEYIGEASHRTGAGYQASVGFGLTYGLSADVQLDGGANVGISRDADDVVLFAGMSFRL